MMSSPDPVRLNEVTLNAWPAVQQVLYDGWLLRYAHGYTRRANSVQVLGESALELGEKLVVAEAWYRTRHLPPVFRLTSYAAPDLDETLAGRGYEAAAPTLVQAVSLDRLALEALSVEGATLHAAERDIWLTHHARWAGLSPKQQQHHRDILGLIPNAHLPALLVVKGRVVACGLAVLEPPFVGLFDIMTASTQRGRGFGRALVEALLTWGQQHGAAWAYLQVMDANEKARRLYQSLGFETQYRYWYRLLRH